MVDNYSLEGARRALAVVNPQFDAIRVPEIELIKLAVQVLFVAVLINAGHAAFED